MTFKEIIDHLYLNRKVRPKDNFNPIDHAAAISYLLSISLCRNFIAEVEKKAKELGL